MLLSINKQWFDFGDLCRVTERRGAKLGLKIVVLLTCNLRTSTSLLFLFLDTIEKIVFRGLTDVTSGILS
jgi:hypothetical protein